MSTASTTSTLEIETRAEETYSFRAEDHTSLRGETRWTWRLARDDWEVRTVSHTVLTSDAHTFRVQAEVDAYEGDTRVFSASWDERIDRDHVCSGPGPRPRHRDVTGDRSRSLTATPRGRSIAVESRLRRRAGEGGVWT